MLKIELKGIPDHEVQDLILQELMGALDKKVKVTIGRVTFMCEVTGYAATSGVANVTLYEVDDDDKGWSIEPGTYWTTQKKRYGK